MSQKPGIVQHIKGFLYFPLAFYFRFFAKIKLGLWKPRVIVITGSIGKTTLFELIKSQVPHDLAYFAEHVNSAYGISVNILGLKVNNASYGDWFRLFLTAPFMIFSKLPRQKIYITEADADRPGEGKFLAELLKPNVTIWVSSSITHSANFDALVLLGKFKNTEEAIAFEYGHFVEQTSELAIVNLDFTPIKKELTRTSAEVLKISKKEFLTGYKVDEDGSEFVIKEGKYKFPAYLPAESYFSIIASQRLNSYLGLEFDDSFKDFEIPPGRGSIFSGVKNTIIIDSSYNASKISVIAFLDLVADLKKKTGRQVTFIFGDMRELGNEAKEEHLEVAKKINGVVDLLYCVGPLTEKYIMPNVKIPAKHFRNSKLLGEFLAKNIASKTIVLVKGSQNEIFLEEVIEPLLAKKSDIKKLCRQSEYWMKVKQNFFRS